ncbi:hypothetical protein DP43_5763 [Burkholderia pseudomallei]|nr:hypothetical protein DP43_5763 [Burkholderia pseudomallei]
MRLRAAAGDSATRIRSAISGFNARGASIGLKSR